MLYERWLEVARAHPNDFALRDLASGQSWTFAELKAAAEDVSSNIELFVHPQGHSAEFILKVLSGWRDGKLICPLESGQVPPAVPAPPAGCVHLKTTSATTGGPRLVAFTASQLAADAQNIVDTMGLRPDWPNLGAISMAHSYGFSNLVLPLLLHGIPLILVPSSFPEAIRRAADGEPALALPAVPALWRAWHEAGAIPRNIRLAISAGAPLAAKLERAIFDCCSLKVHNFYGSTECGGIAYDATNTPRKEDACAGAPMRNVKLAINEAGCLQVFSQAVGETYWPHSSSDLAGGCFSTSDLADISKGVVYLCGRATDQINVAGRKVAPDVIERALLDHNAVSGCVVFGAPSNDIDRAEVIVACVDFHPPGTLDGLKEFLQSRLPAWQLPREWWFVQSLLPNDRGKISRAEWRARWLARRSSPQ